jgi:aryl-alcohol dehydrogenase-like predicted oxidoreductase
MRDGVDSPSSRSQGDPFGDTLYGRDADFDVIEAVVDLARERDVSPVQVSLAWLLQVSGVTAPIVGLTKLSHIDDMMSALDLRLTDDEVASIEAPYVARTSTLY